MRFPHSAKVLANQLAARNSKSKMKPDGEPDGLGVYRTFTFDKPTSKTLGKIVPVLNDPRIADFEMRDGVAYVTFVSTTAADVRDEFLLDDAETVASSQPAEEPEKVEGQDA